MNKEHFIKALQEKRAQGLDSKAAALAVWQSAREQSTRANASLLQVAIAAALLFVFKLTPRQLAITLKALGFSDEDVITAVYAAVVEEGSMISAVDLGAVMLDKDVYPATSKERMQHLLSLCPYPPAEIAQALKILYPLIFVVKSTQPWQDTGISLAATEIALIEYVTGSWSVSPDVRNCGPDGYRFTAKSGYALPGALEGALVGRVDGSAFKVGYKAETPTAKSGQLELCANDDINGIYGNGYSDNSGSMSVKITVRLR